VFRNIFEENKWLKTEMVTIQIIETIGAIIEETKERESQTKMELDKREHQEEILWKQKSRFRWLKKGDRNKKFFHNSLLQRRNQNNITNISRTSRERVESTEDIEKELINYFKLLLIELEENATEAIQEITKHVPKLVTLD